MTVNFKQISFRDIEGKEVTVDLQKQLGNQLYMQGRNIEECELGKRIYFSDGDVNLSEKDCEAVKLAVAGYAYIVRQAVLNRLTDSKLDEYEV